MGARKKGDCLVSFVLACVGFLSLHMGNRRLESRTSTLINLVAFDLEVNNTKLNTTLVLLNKNTSQPIIPISETYHHDDHDDIEYYAGSALRYTRQGHTQLDYSRMNALHLAPLTEWVQEYIHERQFPANCSKAKFFLNPYYRAGFGSQLHVAGSALRFGLDNNIIMLWGPDTCRGYFDHETCGDTVNCECFFQQLSNCSQEDITTENWVEFENLAHQNHKSVPVVFETKLRQLFPSMTQSQMKYWWRGQSVAYLMRFNERTLRDVRAMREDRSVNEEGTMRPKSVNINLRSGDKHTVSTIHPKTSSKYIYKHICVRTHMKSI